MEATPTSEPKLKAPPGTWDTHMHIYDKRYPLAGRRRSCTATRSRRHTK